MESEIWKDIIGFEGRYQISNYGRVKSLRREKITKNNKHIVIKERILKLEIKKGLGYSVCKLDDGKEHKVHRLVAKAFIPNPENKRYIDHKNTIRTDNRVENLKWVTAKENANNPITKKRTEDYARSEIGRKRASLSHKGMWVGGKSPRAKQIIQLSISEEFIRVWESISIASQELNIQRENISKCLKGKIKTCGGFKWKYI